MSNLDKALEWAKNYAAGGYCPGLDGPWAAAEIIQALPDQWVDAGKLREIIEEMNEYLEAEHSNDYGQGFNYATRHWREALEVSLTLAELPTLADMTEEEQRACQWMQADFQGADGELRVFITKPNYTTAEVLFPNGAVSCVYAKALTPLPGEPKLQLPGRESPPSKVSMSEMWVDDGSSPLDAMKLLAEKWEEVDRLKPEEVPHSEPWLIEVNGWKAVGTRYAWYTKNPWTVASLNGLFSGEYVDSEITLIHKLVPETHALPEGMRLADHPDFGRVVVSPWADDDEEYKVFYRDEDVNAGAASYYAEKRNLTFLDGGDNE